MFLAIFGTVTRQNDFELHRKNENSSRLRFLFPENRLSGKRLRPGPTIEKFVKAFRESKTPASSPTFSPPDLDLKSMLISLMEVSDVRSEKSEAFNVLTRSPLIISSLRFVWFRKSPSGKLSKDFSRMWNTSRVGTVARTS